MEPEYKVQSEAMENPTGSENEAALSEARMSPGLISMNMA
jgi:hypothetical protein